MRHTQRTQRALGVVSYLFLLIGLVALVEMVARAVRGSFHFNFGMLGILGIGIFAGLRRYSRAWRTFALVFNWYCIITLSIALFVCVYGQPPALFDQRFSSVPANWLIVPLVMVLLVTLWQYRILTHPAIRRLFDQASRPSNAPQPTAG
jgi:hypothetical protein